MVRSFLLVIYLIFLSCTDKSDIYNHTDNVENLGDDYYYLGDANESQILLNLKPKSGKRIGITVIPAEVTNYNYDSQFIIAKTENSSNHIKEIRYWILDKRKKDVEPIFMDSIIFFKKVDSLNLKINLKKRN